LKIYRCPSFAYSKNVPVYGTNNGAPYLLSNHYRANLFLGWNGYGPGPLDSFPRIGNANGHRFKSVNIGGTLREVFAHPLKLGDVNAAADKTLIFDAYADWQPYVPSPAYGRTQFTNALGDNDRTNPDNYSLYWRKPNIGTWHEGKTNLSFMDGHAERIPWQSDKTFSNGGFEDQDKTYWIPEQ